VDYDRVLRDALEGAEETAIHEESLRLAYVEGFRRGTASARERLLGDLRYPHGRDHFVVDAAYVLKYDRLQAVFEAVPAEVVPEAVAVAPLETEAATSEPPFNESFDARDWARAFVATVHEQPGIPTDEETMLGWFANAIMRGWDERERRLTLPVTDEPAPEAV
jgi:hypothetical protein